ncbi:MAG: hypothetical protein CMN85_13685 [Spongiibacteraceae bacterium]|nr:hypothetical protein [Spongiibacteraceae bacterium]|tara:strand:- start:1788 stop:2012 length:225 start_codon:yes stop_codon:yes gene_type:complete
MRNVLFWNSAIKLIDNLEAIDSGGSDFCLEDELNTFSEAYRGIFDPSNDFEEYVLATLLDRVSRILPVKEGEAL